MLLHLTELSGEPLHRQISEQLATKILCGDFPQGARLQPAHSFATEHKVSVSTVQRAYEDLAQQGWIIYEKSEPILINPLRPGRRRTPRPLLAPSGPEANRRLLEEVAKAQEIQAGLFLKSLPNNSRLHVAAYAEASRPIGGDYYDCFSIDEHQFGLIIADACGNGLPAAMLISQIQAIVKNEVQHHSSIEQTMNHHRQEFGEQRLREVFTGHRRDDAQEIVRSIVEAFKSFESPDGANDDRTLLVVKLLADTY